MKVFFFQHFTLMIMFVFAYGAAIHGQDGIKKHFLKSIQEEAKSVHVNSSVMVPKIWPGQKNCVLKFFCLAEKALKDFKGLSKLTRVLTQYNNETGDTNCHLPINGSRITLQRLLKAVVECANLTMNN